jgi:hypothetical protein
MGWRELSGLVLEVPCISGESNHGKTGHFIETISRMIEKILRSSTKRLSLLNSRG